MYLLDEFIDDAARYLGITLDDQHRTAAVNLLICNHNYTTMDDLVDGVKRIAEAPIEYFEMKLLPFCLKHHIRVTIGD